MSEIRVDMPDEYKLAKSVKKMNLFEKKGEYVIPFFAGSPIVVSIFYLYLFKKYGNKCFISDKFAKYEPKNPLYELIGVALPIHNEYTKEMMVPIMNYLNNVAKNLVKCIERGSDIIIIPLDLVMEINGKRAAHANILVYRKKFSHIEHFEPHGSRFYGANSDSFVKSINLLIRIFIGCINQELYERSDGAEPPIDLVESDKVCPYFGFQYQEERSDYIKIFDKEGGGYCVAWSMFFTELCLRNPHMTSNQIISYIFNQNIKYKEIGNYFRKIIRGYVLFINEKIINYFSFLSDEPLSIEIIKKNINEKNGKNGEFSFKMRIIINLEMESFFNPTYIENRIKFLTNEIKSGGSYIYIKNSKSELDIINRYRSEMDNIGSPLTSDSYSNQPPNIKQEKEKEKDVNQKECPPGKVLNPVSNRCNKIKAPKEERKLLLNELINKRKECPPGKLLNPDSNRCKKIKTNKECPPGKLLNPDSNRCKRIKTRKECPPGKLLNPESNRCIKIKTKKECPPGKLLNPDSKRCIKIKTRKQKPSRQRKI